MPITKGLDVKTPEGKAFPAMPKGVYPFELIDVSLVEKKKYQSEELEMKIQFKFACIKEGPYYGRFIWRDVSQKLSKFKGGSNLYNVLKGILNREITEEEIANQKEVMGMEFYNSLIGTQLLLVVGQNTSEQTGKVFNSIDSYLPIEAKLPMYNPERQPTEFVPPALPPIV